MSLLSTSVDRWKGSRRPLGPMICAISVSRACEPPPSTVRFALAAYNAGWGHLQDARRLAAQVGWDENKWFGHVEKAMLMLEQHRFYRHARYGYVRGSEVFAYVSNIQSRYDHYVRIFPE